MSPGTRNDVIWRREPLATLWLHRNPPSTSVQRDGISPRWEISWLAAKLATVRGSSAMRCRSCGDRTLDLSSRCNNREYGLPISMFISTAGREFECDLVGKT